MNGKKYLRDTNELVDMESKRIIDSLRRKGLVIENELEAVLFLSMTIEQINNKIGMMGLIQDRLGVSKDKIEDMIVKTMHVCFRIFMAIVGSPVNEDEMGYNDYTNNLLENEKFFGEEVINICNVLSDIQEDYEDK